MVALIVFTLFFLCASAFARTPYQSNQFMDTVLYTHLRNAARLSNVDPARIVNFTAQFTDNSVFTKNNVKIDYYAGEMTGLLDVQRSGNCSPVKRIYGNDTLNCTIVFRNNKFRYQGRIKYGNLPTANINVQANMTHTYAFVEVTTSVMRNYPVLKAIRLTQIGTIKAKHTGTGSISSKLNKINDKPFTGRALIEFNNVFNFNFIPNLARAVSNVPMPVH